MDLSVKPTDKNKGETPRKRVAVPSNWKRQKDKTKRYAAKGFPAFPTCRHEHGSLRCKTLTAQDIRRFHSKFYQEPDKIYQDNFILKHVTMQTIKRRRPKNNKNKVQDARAKYFIRNRNKEMIPVCLATFLKALKPLSRFRINNITKTFYDKNELPKERRGGDTTGNKFHAKRESIKTFLNSLQCSETHYCTNRSGRKYLPPELNIRKLWRMYIARTVDETLHAKECYFRYIFNRLYNLGFGSPRVDVCSKCLELSEKIKSCKDPALKSLLITEKRVHSLRSKAFYSLLKENKNDLLILSFDCQKNQPLPKLPDQSTYYSRQLYLNNFCIVQGHSKSKLTKENVTSYVWTENEFNKGSNEISSCIIHHLNSVDMSPYTTVRLVSDGCGGQNKNTILVSAVSYWFLEAPENIKEVQIVFPMTGHSFIPPDRVFGNIEKEIKKREVITSPDEYVQIIKNFSAVRKVGRDVIVKDWKTTVGINIKAAGSWHFGIQASKRLYLTKTKRDNIVNVLVQGERTYRLRSETGIAARSIVKRGKSLEGLAAAATIPTGNYVAKEQKKEDVDSLLKKHYGNEWRIHEHLTYFKHVLDGVEIRTREENNAECIAMDELPAFQI